MKQGVLQNATSPVCAVWAIPQCIKIGKMVWQLMLPVHLQLNTSGMMGIYNGLDFF